MKASLIASFVLLAGALAQSQTPSRGLRPAASPPDSLGKLRTGKNYALIIATDNYDDKSWPHLQNPVNDARTIAEELKSNYGYVEPDLLLNATLDAVSAKLASYLDRTFDPGDSLLIFFAGHGKFDERLARGYLAFRNSKYVDPLNRSYLSHSDLSNTVDAIRCRRILLVIDACFGGTFDNQVALRGANELQYPEASKAEIVGRKSQLTTRLFLTSGGKEYVPDGRPGAHSPFASQILRALRTYGGDSGLVTFQDVFQQVDKVTQNNPQYGWFGKAEPGSDFWFARALTTSAPAGDGRPKMTKALGSDDGTTVARAPAHEDEWPIPLHRKTGETDNQVYVWIPPGNFMMGCSPNDDKCDDDEKPPHAERVEVGFWMAQTEVTQEAWNRVHGRNDDPSHFHWMNLGPVESVDWNEASAYCKTIGGRLPSEKEWEYAARAGTTTALGMRPSEILGRFPLDGRAWYAGNSNGSPHPAGYGSVGRTSGFGVGENQFYLSDMLGNVWEWTRDNYVAVGRESQAGNKVARGGSWMDTSDRIRVSARLAKPATFKGSEVGFRCVADWPLPNVRVD